VQEVPPPEAEIVGRFFGTEAAPAQHQFRLAANPAIENPLSLQVLFAGKLQLDPQALTRALRSYHPSMANGLFEIDPQLAAQGTPLGLVGWGQQVIKLVGFDAPMPAEVVAKCVQPAHYPQDLKARALAHQAHTLLYYAGHCDDPREQYVALAVVAGILSDFGALVVLNESAHTSMPAGVYFDKTVRGDRLDVVRAFPLLLLFCGFVKYEVEGFKGVWMRTHGCHLLRLPDLAFRAKGHFQGEFVFEMFNNILNYLLESGAELDDGHTMQIETEAYLRLRLPKTKEHFLKSPGAMFVAEMIRADEINR
jgi:hypothetical protein